MSSIEIRAFERRDREQLTELVNAHVDVVVPGRSVSVNAVLSQLEREPGEVVVDPWVTERTTLVAVRREQVVAAALLTRFADDDRVSDSYRGGAEVRWLVCWPQHADAGDALAAACIATMDRWGAATQWADGSLPAPSVYGIPDAWPHVRGILERAGFEPEGRVEVVVAAAVADLPQAGPPPVDGLALRRMVGDNGTAFVAHRGDEPVGLFELRSDVTTGGALSRLAGWGEAWNLHVDEGLRRRGVATWLVGHGADWLRLGEVRMLLAEYEAGNDAGGGFLRAVGFRELTRTERGVESEGLTRCGWVPLGDPLYVAYHDDEWGVPTRDDRELFELLTLEGAQAGLSWSTILRKREGYRRAFAGFDVERVARFGPRDVERLMADAGIVRNRLKIESTVANAQAVLALDVPLAELLWSFVGGEQRVNAWRTVGEIPAETPESKAMSKELKRRGFRFVGPTVLYALMQAAGLVDDHTVDCFRYGRFG